MNHQGKDNPGPSILGLPNLSGRLIVFLLPRSISGDRTFYRGLAKVLLALLRCNPIDVNIYQMRFNFLNILLSGFSDVTKFKMRKCCIRL